MHPPYFVKGFFITLTTCFILSVIKSEAMLKFKMLVFWAMVMGSKPARARLFERNCNKDLYETQLRQGRSGRHENERTGCAR